MTDRNIQAAITPLRLVFWGGLICVLDFTFASESGGTGWVIDVFNDFVGMALITWGVFRLARIDVHARYRSAMGFVRIAALLGCLDALQRHFIYPKPGALDVLLSIVGIVTLVGTVVFCVAMGQFSREAELERSAASWRTTRNLFLAIYVVPLGLLYAWGVIAALTNEPVHLDLGPLGLLLIPVLLAPFIGLFISTSRMKAEAAATVRGRNSAAAGPAASLQPSS